MAKETLESVIEAIKSGGKSEYLFRPTDGTNLIAIIYQLNAAGLSGRQVKLPSQEWGIFIEEGDAPELQVSSPKPSKKAKTKASASKDDLQSINYVECWKTSSNIHSFDWSPSVGLAITFKLNKDSNAKGKTYTYPNAGLEVYRDLSNAKSKGSHYARYIRSVEAYQ